MDTQLKYMQTHHARKLGAWQEKNNFQKDQGALCLPLEVTV